MITKNEAIDLIKKAIERLERPGVAVFLIDETGENGRYTRTKLIVRDGRNRILFSSEFERSADICEALSDLIAWAIRQRID